MRRLFTVLAPLAPSLALATSGCVFYMNDPQGPVGDVERPATTIEPQLPAFLGGLGDEEASTPDPQHDLFATIGELTASLGASDLVDEWRRTKRAVAILAPPEGAASPVDTQLDAMLSEVETWLIAQQGVSVVARERQEEMIREAKVQTGAAYDSARIARLGKQIGVRYFVTGKVTAHDATDENGLRVRYVLYLRVLDVQTSVVRWQERRTFTARGAMPTSATAYRIEPPAPAPPAAETRPNVAAGAPAAASAAPGEGRFSRAAAVAALAPAALLARGCGGEEGITGEVNTRVVFDHDGRAVSVLLEPALRGTTTGACVARHLKRAAVPPFAGVRGVVEQVVELQ
jgi:penicillin-binding protein activator